MRREHTWYSLMVLLAASVVGVAVLHLLFDPRPTVVRVWDFTELPPAEWEWRFPQNPPELHALGVAYTARPTGRGPFLRRLGLPAEAFNTVRITVHVIDLDTGEEVPPSAAFYWARESDTANIGKKWPFTVPRGFNCVPEDRHEPNVLICKPAWASDLHGSEIWSGTIDGLYFGVSTPGTSAQGYKIVFSRIELLA